MAKNSEKKLLLRLPNKIYKEVKNRSDKNHRSLNSQIIHDLEQRSCVQAKEDPNFNLVPIPA